MSPWTGEKVLVLVELPIWHLKNHYLILAKNYMAEKWQTWNSNLPLSVSPKHLLFSLGTGLLLSPSLCIQTLCPSRLLFKQPFSKKLFLLTQEKSQPESSPDLPQHSRKMQSQAGRRGEPSGYSSTRGLDRYSAHGVLGASVLLLPPAPRVQCLGLPAFLFFLQGPESFQFSSFQTEPPNNILRPTAYPTKGAVFKHTPSLHQLGLCILSILPIFRVGEHPNLLKHIKRM